MAGGATMAAATCWGRYNYCCGGNSGGNLWGGSTLFPSECQWEWMKAVGGSGGGSGRQSAADDSVDGSGQRQRGASSPVVVGGVEAIVGGQLTMAS